MKPVCIYHNRDLDGRCSAAIVVRAHPTYGIELIGMDYGDEIPWDKLEKRYVYMVDFCFQPFSEMVRLAEVANVVCWIDHHKTAIEEAERQDFNSLGLRDINHAACELTWQYFQIIPFGDYMPTGVHWLGRYDIWKHEENPEILPFQYGMRSLDTEPTSQVWDAVFDNSDEFVNEVCVRGKAILSYVKEAYRKLAKQCCFEIELDGYQLIAANVPFASSQFFDSIFEPAKHDMMCSFYKKQDGSWTVSLYSTKENIDCSKVAKKYGGGGHKGAAGFLCARLLPWEPCYGGF